MSDIPNPFDGDISDEAVASWLEQFKDEERPVIQKLLLAFKYYSSKKVAYLVKELYKSVSSNLRKPKEMIWFVPVGYVAKSGSIIAYYFRTQNNLPQDRFIAPSDISTLPLTKDEAVVFLDDFLGSGNQACQVWQNVVIPTKKSADCQFAYAVLVGFQNGLENVRSCTGFKAFAVEILTEEHLPFSPDATLFSSNAEKQNAKEIVQKYGSRLYPNHPLGYRDSQGLVGFFYSTPNNSLPIFWSTESSWKPILSHGESYRDPAFLIGPPPGLRRESTSDSPRKPIVDSEELGRYDIDPDMAIKIFSEFRKAPVFLVLAPILKELQINNETFSDILKLIGELKHSEHEKEPVCSALLIISDKTDDRLVGNKILSAGSYVTSKSINEILSLSNLLNGFDGAVVLRSDGHVMGNYLYHKNGYDADQLIPRKYQLARNASLKTSGDCFFYSQEMVVFRFSTTDIVFYHIEVHPGICIQLNSKEVFGTYQRLTG